MSASQHDYRLQSAREIKRKGNEKAAKNKTGVKSLSIKQFLETSRIYNGQDADQYVLVKAFIEGASHNALFSRGGQKGRNPGN